MYAIFDESGVVRGVYNTMVEAFIVAKDLPNTSVEEVPNSFDVIGNNAMFYIPKEVFEEFGVKWKLVDRITALNAYLNGKLWLVDMSTPSDRKVFLHNAFKTHIYYRNDVIRDPKKELEILREAFSYGKPYAYYISVSK